MNFQSLIGEVVSVIIPRWDKTLWQQVKILGVEAGGIWITSQAITNLALSHFGLPASPKTMAIFVPYHEITAAFAPTDGPSLNEKAFL